LVVVTDRNGQISAWSDKPDSEEVFCCLAFGERKERVGRCDDNLVVDSLLEQIAS
jgi:hypothetical protein